MCRAQDLVCIHSDLIHSGSPSAGDQIRMYTSTYLCQLGLPHRDDFDAPAIQAYLAAARTAGDARLLRFFGEGVGQWLAQEEAGWAAVAAVEKAARQQQPLAIGTRASAKL
jgi:hypothetical protein